MKKFNKKEVFRNVGSSWFALGVNVLVGIFLSPFILHRLGDEAFGLWVLIFSVTGYYGLFDLGIRSSIIRYVSKYTAVDDRQQLNGLINTSLFSYSVVGLVCLAITAVGSFYVDSIFKVPASFLSTARLLFLMVGTSVSLGFPLGVFGGILEGLQRFYLLNTTSLVSTICRAALIVIALRHGSGLLMIAFITVALPLVTGIINGAIVLSILPLNFGRRYVDRASLRKIANYSGATFMIIVAGRLRFKTDAMVIGTFLSSAAITYFAIGSRLVDYATEVVSSLAQIFVPMSSQMEATGDMSQLRRLFLAGNRACALIVFPMAAILVVMGKSVIEAWVGLKYVHISYPVLIILLIPSTLMLAQAASGRILFGISKHKAWAWVVLAEGVANLVLSITLVRRYGIIGDALGTAIPLACSMLFFLPHYLCRLLEIKLRVYLKEAFLLPFALCAPLVGILVGMQQWSYAHNYFHLVMNMTAGLAVYGAGLLWAVRTHRIWNVDEIAAKVQPEEVALSLLETYQHEEA